MKKIAILFTLFFLSLNAMDDKDKAMLNQNFLKNCKNHILWAIEAYLDNEIDINATDRKGRTGLILACRRKASNPEDFLKIVSLLADRGIDQTIRDQFGNTAEDYARENGNIDYIEPQQMNAFSATEDQISALMAHGEMDDGWVKIFDHCFGPSSSLMQQYDRQFQLARQPYLQFEDTDYQEEEKMPALEKEDSDEEMADLVSELINRPRSKRRMFKSMTIPNTKLTVNDKHFLNILKKDLAICIKNEEREEELCQEILVHLEFAAPKPNINAQFKCDNDDDQTYANGDSMLAVACRAGLFKVANLLLQKGADPNLKSDQGQTALHKACIFKNRKVVKLLLENKAQVNAQDNYGMTALHYACMNADLNTFNLLLLHPQINLEIINKKRFTIAHLVALNCLKCREAIAYILENKDEMIRKGSDPDTQLKNHELKIANYEAIYSIIKQKYAHLLSFVDCVGRTAVDYQG